MKKMRSIKNSINIESLFEAKKAKKTLNEYKLNFKKLILYSFLMVGTIYM
jgi:hypothetical protein